MTLELSVLREIEDSGVLPEGMGCQGMRVKRVVGEKMAFLEIREILDSKDFLVSVVKLVVYE